ncbi:MAG TPA: DHHA1 domain-containing protein, partial [Hyphomicrobiales bacterium]|nr:DHHA1 domain-containing protein [Hyphomicrobiales bacterium]
MYQALISGQIDVVTDTLKKAEGLFVHVGKVEEGKLVANMPLELVVDGARRAAIRANHSATHLLHSALRRVLGEHVTQKGSLVSRDRLRFDFSHPKPIEAAELQEIEDIANEIVLQNEAVRTRLMAVDDARAAGAMALFGEKYGDEVRVVSMGSAAAAPYSIELCGGTHVSRTGDIGLVSILSESAVSAGVRRIEALTGMAARRYLEGQNARLRDVASVLKAPQGEIVERVSALMEERRRLERELADAKRQLAMGGGAAASATDAVKTIGSVKFFGRAIEGIPAKDLKGLVDEGKKTVGSGVVAIVGVSEDGKAGVVVGVTEDLVGKFNAVDLVRVGSTVLGGKGGGGRPDMAQAGGPEGAKAGEALSAIEAAVAAA